jgi:hypothetical protein
MIAPTIDVAGLERAERFHALALELQDALFKADLKPNELRMAWLIVKLSLRQGRTTTPPLRQKDFGLLAGIRETHIAETIGWVMGKKIVLIAAADCFRINEDPKTWLVGDRVTPEARDREAELLRDWSQREFFDQRAIRAGDHRVALVDASVEVRAESSEFRKMRGGSTSEIRKSGVVENFRNPEVADRSGRVARTRAPATCHVPLSSTKHEHDHVHALSRRGAQAELTPAQNDLLDQIEELTQGEGKTAHFRTTWEMRVRDNEIAAFQSIGETRMAKQEGRIRRCVGGTLNWHFKNFRDGARQRERQRDVASGV